MQKIKIGEVDIEINVPTVEEMIALKEQLEAAKKVINDLKTANNHLVGDVLSADQKIQALKAQQNHLKKDMDGTLLALAEARQTAKENTATCQVLRDQLNNTKAELNAANFIVKYWQDRFRVVVDKLQEIEKVLK